MLGGRKFELLGCDFDHAYELASIPNFTNANLLSLISEHFRTSIDQSLALDGVSYSI